MNELHQFAVSANSKVRGGRARWQRQGPCGKIVSRSDINIFSRANSARVRVLPCLRPNDCSEDTSKVRPSLRFKILAGHSDLIQHRLEQRDQFSIHNHCVKEMRFGPIFPAWDTAHVCNSLGSGCMAVGTRCGWTGTLPHWISQR